MSDTRVSVIIPTYGGAGSLGRAIGSVLDQTHRNLELIVVDDASPDNVADVVARFGDSRITCVRHESNRGAAAARSTGLGRSSGDVIAFLDQDDVFHPARLQAHVEYLDAHPDVGFTYNPYFDLLPSSEAIRTVFQPPERVSLADLTMGFYLPPTSWVVRRKWVAHDDVWHENLSLHGGEIVRCGRLFMAGCRFARIDRVLHARGYQAGRRFRNLEKHWQDELTCQDLIFNDPRCPPDVVKTRPFARTAITVMWANVALAQGETALARTLLRDAGTSTQSVFPGRPSPFLEFLVGYCVDDESQDYEALLDRVFAQLSQDVADAPAGLAWARPRGHLVRGVRAMIWDRPDNAVRHWARAAELGPQVDQGFVQQVTHELRGYGLHKGDAAAASMASSLCSALAPYIGSRNVEWIRAGFLTDRALRRHRSGRRDGVAWDLARAIAGHPGYLFDRGVLSVLGRSLTGFSSRADR